MHSTCISMHHMEVQVYVCMHVWECDIRSDSGMELVRLGEELEVMVLSVGLPVNGRPYSPSEGGRKGGRKEGRERGRREGG